MLTDRAIRALAARATLYRVADADGLCLEVTPNGAKHWRFRYRFGGKAQMIGLGRYPLISLAAARESRDQARRLLTQGMDPAADRQATRKRVEAETANRFEAVARDWLAVRIHEWTETQYRKEKGRLEQHAFPWIGHLPIGSLGVAEIRPLIDKISKRGHLEQAHRLRFQLSRIFQYAVATERAERDPAADLKAVLPTRRRKNFPTITEPAKVGELLRAIDGFGGTFPVACALKLAPLLFVRPGELRAAEWREIELDADDGPRWVIPPPRRKLRRADKESATTPPHIVPLSLQTVAILLELQAVTGRSQYLFPGLRSPKRPMSDNTINAALRRIGYDKDTIVGHGFRHMASTLLNELGFPADAIERQLSHKEPGVRGVYNKAEHLPARRQMMQAWADYLDSLRAGRDGKPATEAP